MTGAGIWVLLWVAVAGFVVYRHAEAGRHVGLLVTYVLSLAALHCLAPALYLLPWEGPVDLETTFEGLRQSTFAIVGLAIGAQFARARLLRTEQESEEPSSIAGGMVSVSSRLVTIYLVSGVVLYVVLFSAVGNLPTVRALISTGSTLMVVGIALKCWNAWQAGRHLHVYLWLMVAAGFPALTILVQGFLGYGFAAMVMVFTFFGSFHRPTWRVVAIGLVCGYLGLSVYVTYMRDRQEIRQAVWTGASTATRIDRIEATVLNFEWFDWRRSEHILRVNDRLNQNYMVGAAVIRLQEGHVELARGETFREAALSVIPRTIWPDKPMVAGSGDLVSRFTGMKFADGTSVGIGQVMECYVNFGTPGVFFGFIVIGFLLVYVDRSAASRLTRGRSSEFLLWYLPGLSLLQVGGSLTEVTAMAAGSWVVAIVFARIGELIPSSRVRVEPRVEATS